MPVQEINDPEFTILDSWENTKLVKTVEEDTLSAGKDGVAVYPHPRSASIIETVEDTTETEPTQIKKTETHVSKPSTSHQPEENINVEMEPSVKVQSWLNDKTSPVEDLSDFDERTKPKKDWREYLKSDELIQVLVNRTNFENMIRSDKLNDTYDRINEFQSVTGQERDAFDGDKLFL